MKYKEYLLLFCLVVTVLVSGCSFTQISSDKNDLSSEETNEIVNNAEGIDTIYITTTVDEPFSQSGWRLEIKGIQEYDSIKTELFDDIPQKENKYLVLFLKITNNTSANGYISNEFISACVDGHEISSAYLVNSPEGYPTIKDNINVGETRYGFIVWEVPENWTKMKFEYNGWKHDVHAVPVITITPDDLFTPISYEDIDWYE